MARLHAPVAIIDAPAAGRWTYNREMHGLEADEIVEVRKV